MRLGSDDLSKELNNAKNEKKALNLKLELEKSSFIRDINGDLGNDIKKNPNKVNIIIPPWYVRLGRKLKKFFTKF